jgi:predicted transcriptional regulator of viral defense system
MTKTKVTYNDLIKLGTICHNRRATIKEISEYLGRDGKYLVKALVRQGWMYRVRHGEYFPTPLGWEKIHLAGEVAYEFGKAEFKD